MVSRCGVMWLEFECGYVEYLFLIVRAPLWNLIQLVLFFVCDIAGGTGLCLASRRLEG